MDHGVTSNDDSLMYNQAIGSNDEEKFNAISVDSPVKRNGNIYYTINAFDSTG